MPDGLIDKFQHRVFPVHQFSAPGFGTILPRCLKPHPGMIAFRTEREHLASLANAAKHGPITIASDSRSILFFQDLNRDSEQHRQFFFSRLWNSLCPIFPGAEHLTGYIQFSGYHTLRIIAAGPDIVKSSLHCGSPFPDARSS